MTAVVPAFFEERRLESRRGSLKGYVTLLYE